MDVNNNANTNGQRLDYGALLAQHLPPFRWICDPIAPNKYMCGNDDCYCLIVFPEGNPEDSGASVHIVIYNAALPNPTIADYYDTRNDLDVVLKTVRSQIEAWKWLPGESFAPGSQTKEAQSQKSLTSGKATQRKKKN